MPLLFPPAVNALAGETSTMQNSANEPRHETGKENTPVAATSSNNGTVRQGETQPQPQPQPPQSGRPPQQPQRGANPTPPQTSTPTAKPVFMMKRLGGPFPFSKPRPAASSKPSSPVTTTPSSPRLDPGLSPRPDVDSTPQPNTKQASAPTVLKSENDSKQLLTGSLDDMDGLDGNHPIVLVESDIDIPVASASASANTRDSVSVSAAPTPSVPQVATASSERRRGEDPFDDRIYKVFRDENGEIISSQGALLPPGYKKAQNTTFPWICPIRSCQRMLPSLMGLGKHFCNSHRAAKLNDNMDGTLTDLGTWTDPTRGDGRSRGGTPKPPRVMSRKPMSLEISPMVPPMLHAKVCPKPREVSDGEPWVSRSKQPSRPSRGGPRQSSASVKAAALDDYLEDSESESSSCELLQPSESLRKADGQKPQTWTKFSDNSPSGDKADEPIYSDAGFTGANSERRYDQWPDKNGILKKAFGILLPDGYEQDASMPDRPWICPIRSCRRLYKKLQDLGVHFSKIHRGCLLNDNQDGTLSILTQHDKMSSWPQADAPARVISKNGDNDEPLMRPQRPIYRTPTNISWVDVFSEEKGALRGVYPQTNDDSVVSLETVDEAAPVGVKNDNRPALTWATEERLRLYSEWHAKDSFGGKKGELVSMAGALIPEGYKCDRTFLNRMWICPVRTCRLTCKAKAGLGNHFSHSHGGQTLNDNGDGTFSIVGSYVGKEPKVVSRIPLTRTPDAPPLAEPQIPPSANLIPEEERLKALLANANAIEQESEPEVQSPTPEAESDPDGLWRYISEVTGLSGPPPDHAGIQFLLKQSRVRELVVTGELLDDQDTRQIGALLIQVTGKAHDKPCTICRRNGLMPFDQCVNTVWTDSQGFRALYGSYIRSCANCIYRKNENNCSVKAYIPAGLASIKPNLGAIAYFGRVEDLGDDDYHSMENELNRRRSERLRSPPRGTSSNGNNTPINGAAGRANAKTKRSRPSEVEDELLPMTKRGRRTIEVPERNEKAPQLRRMSTIPDSDSPSHLEVLDFSVMGEDAEMEDWEQGPGKVLATAASSGRGKAGDSSSRELAFSSVHLLSAPSESSNRQGRTIQVAKGLSFVATHIPSGTVHRFVPDETKLRMCTLANGKLRVTVDGEPEFAIGTNGVFKLSPGKGCRIVNKAYVDAILHVTSVEGAE